MTTGSSEATPEDVQEQRAAVVDEPPQPEPGRSDEAPEADVAEQRLEVSLDEEEDR
ncbi:MAG: hypothetical protein WCD35_00165 [Mycobacteriales bacterium]